MVGAVHTNTLEGFWSIVKRGIVGTFHTVSKKYLPLCVNEREFRYAHRLNAMSLAPGSRPADPMARRCCMSDLLCRPVRFGIIALARMGVNVSSTD